MSTLDASHPSTRPALHDHPATGPFHARLPHRPIPEATQFITFRLADALLPSVRCSPVHVPRSRDVAKIRTRLIEQALDDGYGSCVLARPEVGGIVQETLLYWHEVRYVLHAWVVMPNHVHVLVTPGPNVVLSRMVQSWKVHSAMQANRLLSRAGDFWQRDYFDRIIRNRSHYLLAINYIEENPVKAGLCRARDEWAFSSASVWK